MTDKLATPRTDALIESDAGIDVDPAIWNEMRRMERDRAMLREALQALVDRYPNNVGMVAARAALAATEAA